jgi:hypothetical protein
LFGFELLAAQLGELGGEGVVLLEPGLALDLGALAVAGVGEEVEPLLRELRAGIADGGGEDRADLPVFLGDEGLDLALALDDEADGDGLDAAGGEALGDLAPEERADLVTDDAVEDSAGLLGVDAIHVDREGVGEGLLDLGLGDCVEDDAEALASGMPRASLRCQAMASPSRSKSVAR